MDLMQPISVGEPGAGHQLPTHDYGAAMPDGEAKKAL